MTAHIGNRTVEFLDRFLFLVAQIANKSCSKANKSWMMQIEWNDLRTRND